ncbi:hydroxymethylglutaryl-CoA reductase, degradative [Constantimarinum furrinae]|uniref:3-hydroxy-3-methylglutaryl coenzyme A reductase n=1 Tax=Constantimarinum furrinae TaxID=2562285 RepID=A0A7G8PRY6_9FLAO|nr:hydroxymethylglutaryl-CoA reductase, degradative [Constantimarinum furrinae]QNJ97102.1 hydroxymethylglutaryl-CoA reductase [Constantimarinum furrinae]
MVKPVSGFSKKTKAEKIEWLSEAYLDNDPSATLVLKKYWNSDTALQKLHDDFIENTLSNYYLPFGIAPNFLINDRLYALPMVLEESSVVAAASNAAKFWLSRGGFKAEVIATHKNGQVHLNYKGAVKDLTSFFAEVKPKLIESISEIQRNMVKRGGGLIDITLVNATEKLEHYFQLHCTFETKDAMGANFINTCLEQIAHTFKTEAAGHDTFKAENTFPEVVLSILSNYTPECLVKAEVSCKVSELKQKQIDGKTFAEKFVRAIDIAKAEPRRAVTHNKGIMNGVDAVILATGNDFRAVEAGVHAYASKDGQYTSLTSATIEHDTFKFSIEIPLALGTVGGLTSLHPLVAFALQVLQKPSAKELMEICAVAGLAQNFAAVRSLVTTGIQEGHMKMHLMNILNQLQTTSEEKEQTVNHFKTHAVSHSAVVEFVNTLRTQ